MEKIDKVYTKKLQVKMGFWCSQRNAQLELGILVEDCGHSGS